MTELLIPLGLLGLLSIAVLILIYVIRPNYQTKNVTSTYIWKLSLGYKRKRPPVNKIRNILIFLCQLLILASMALIMAWPAIVERQTVDDTDVIYILDSSASMYAETDGVTRFDRALSKIKEGADSVISSGGNVTVIVADDEPYFLARRVDSARRMKFMNDLDKLAEDGSSYAVSDVEGALGLCKEVLLENPSASVCFYTDTEYEYVPEKVTVELIRDDTEWNAAILGATAVLEDGYYVVTVQVAAYGASQELNVKVSVDGANSDPAYGVQGSKIEFDKYVDCTDDAVQTVIFRVGGGVDEGNVYYKDLGDTQKFISYNSILVSIEADDSYPVDNNFSVYGGNKPILRVMYYSTDPNPFTQTALGIARNAISSRCKLEVTEVKKGDAPILEGFDFYVFEHGMPEYLPSDGAVLLLDPDPNIARVPQEAGFTVDRQNSFGSNLVSLAEGDDYAGHPVTKYIVANDIQVSMYDRIVNYDPGYRVLLSYDNDPMLMVRNDGNFKVGVMAFSVHYSTLPKLPENFLLMYSIIDYFFPSLISGNAFEVGESFTLNTWGEEIVFSGTGDIFTSEELPANISIDTPGSYKFDQTTYYGKQISAEVFIKPPAEESNIRRVDATFTDPYEGTEPETVYRDLLLILASVLVGLLFAEWILHSLESR